jgi:O-acetyl-ADP-ribose deacetylase (regulator of RNase III)
MEYRNRKIKYINGNLLEIDTDVIVQQLNCLTTRAHGLSKSIADKWLWADRYTQRKQIGIRNCAVEEDRDVPGTISILNPPDGVIAPIVVGLFGQYSPGKPLQYDYKLLLSSQDTTEQREKWFSESLLALAEFVNKNKFKTIAFPYQIGCGLAGGDWYSYRTMLEEFSNSVTDTTILIVRLIK